jgi:aminopeptidase N
MLFFAFLLFISGRLFAQNHAEIQTGSKATAALSDTVSALNYEIHLHELDFTEKTISATTTVTLVSKVDGLTQITLELLDLTVEAVVADGNPVPDFQHQSPFLYIPLPDPLNSGETTEITVSYHGQPFHEGWGGFHWSGQYAFNLGVGFESDPHNLGKAWFPCIDDFQDRAFYEIFVTVENPKVAVCGGTLMDVIDNGDDTKTFHWKFHADIPTYLASVTVGEYVNVPSVFTSMTGDDIPIDIYVRPFDTAKVAGSFQTLIPVLEAFEDYFGPYQWERVGYTSTALGAMEHSTNISYPHQCITGSLTYEWLMAHEVSHQYFGNMVTCATDDDMWLNEGWAVFCESLYREALYGDEAYHADMFARHRDVLYTAHVVDGSYLALYGIPTQYTYGKTVYQKGALIVHTLRHYMGDELFFPAVRAYLDEYKFNYADSWDLRDILSDHSGVDLTDFFNTWVFTPGFPEFSVDSFNVQPAGSDYNVTVFARQKLKGPSQLANSNRVEVTFMDAQWQKETVLMEFSGETGQQTFTVSINPELAMADFYDKAADATTDLTLVLTETGDNINLFDVFAKVRVEEIAPGDSAFVRITHRWAPPDDLKTPLEGLTLSDYRHWRVEGLFPESINITGSFMYNKYNSLDGNLMNNPADSLVILYRKDRSDDWQSVPFDKQGSPYVGYIEVPDMQTGEYTLAVWDELFVKVPEIMPNSDTGIKIYPNPASDMVIMEFAESVPDAIYVYNAAGLQVDSLTNINHQHYFEWNTAALKRGNYILQFVDSKGKEITTKKLILN